MRKKVSLVGVALVLAAGTGAALFLAASGAETPGPPPASIGDQLDRQVPAVVANAELTDQTGHDVSLRDYEGRVVFLVPFLTSCQEECPITTGALESIEHSLAAEGLTHKVAIVEVTVDPARDSPERMAAYAELTSVSWPLLTAAPATIAALWQFFGIYYQDVPDASPPGIDWESGKPYSYDVDHSDGFILLDAHGRERFVAGGMVRGAHVPAALRRLLDAQGVSDLQHPGGGSWTINQALAAIGWILGRDP